MLTRDATLWLIVAIGALEGFLSHQGNMWAQPILGLYVVAALALYLLYFGPSGQSQSQ